ncbi:VOC family protein [Paucibacter sp. O1-1]|nr:VOC family protein [Paucibacter sp. O1-1]MDA3826771.1 VOC family protein [Paucibacter sp. O1-1]
MRLAAVRVFVRDLVSAQLFYQQTLGFKLKHGDAGAGYCVFDAGPADLVLESVASDAPEQALVGRFTGLSFAAADIRARHAALSAAGVPFSGAPEQQPWGGWLATLVDPAGNQLQLVQYPG